MRRGIRISGWLIALAVTSWPAIAFAQSGSGLGSLGNLGLGNTTMAGMGMPAMPGGNLYGVNAPSAKSADPGISITQGYVSFIDSAAPRTGAGLRFDGFYNIPQPMRAEYLFAKGGVPNSVGFPLPETKVNYQDLTSFAEFAPVPWLSFFVEAPYRFLNPEVNSNERGAGDMKYGMKLCTWSSDQFIATILLRLYQPTARGDLGTRHWSIEPGLLAAYQWNPKILIEGELRYWISLNGTDFAGDVFRYGLGVSYGQRSNGVWYTPVLEGVGWTVIGGKSMIASAPDAFIVQSSHGDTIVNACLGVRFGYGKNLETYIGYARAVTHSSWSRDTYRFEIRYNY